MTRPTDRRESADLPRWVRADVVRAYDRGESTTVLGSDGAARRFDGDSAALVREVLGYLDLPRTRAELVDHLARRAGTPEAPAEVPDALVDDLLGHLRASGAVRAAGAPGPGPPPRAPGAGRRVLLGVTGAVAAVDAPVLVRMLQERGYALRVALTRTARRFVSADALEALCHGGVYRGLWDRSPACPVPHINLAEWAELVVVCPASATSVARLARGDCSDLVSAACVATRAPVVVVPSMNPGMFSAPSVARNLDALRDDGVVVVHPARGIEVAHPPGARRGILGPAPPAAVVADLVDHLARTELAPRAAPTGREAWDALYRDTPEAHWPWTVGEPERALCEALDRLARERPGCALLDVGTGAGTVALAAARRGMEATGADVSPQALARAAERAQREGAPPVAWVLDDARATRLRGAYDVVTDRGCLHVLPREAWPAYAASAARLVGAGGALLVLAHGTDEPADHGTHRTSADELRAVFGAAFALERATPCAFEGPGGIARRGVLAEFRRV